MGYYLLENSVCAVIVTYNRLKLLKICLDSVLNQNVEISHIVIINNKSTDGTSDYLNGLDNEKLIIKNMEKNYGGAKGFSKGVEIAFKYTNDDFIWIMDDDTFPDKDALDELLKSSRILKKDFGFLCSNVRWKDGSITNRPQIAKDWGEEVENNLIRVNTATFVSVLLPRNVINGLGIPTAELFIWGDDTEYTTRISSKYPCYFVVKSKVLHYTAKNLSNITILNDSLDRIPRYTYMFRNWIYIDKKYASKKRVFRRFLSEFALIFSIIVHGKDHKILRISAVIKGISKGFFFNPKIQYISK